VFVIRKDPKIIMSCRMRMCRATYGLDKTESSILAKVVKGGGGVVHNLCEQEKSLVRRMNETLTYV
jgi:predicted transcriptional regulator